MENLLLFKQISLASLCINTLQIRANCGFFFGRCFSSFVRRTTKYLFFMCTTTQRWFVCGGLESNGLLVGSVSCISLCWWEWEGNVKNVIHLWTFHKVALLVHCFQVELEFEMLVLYREENWRNQRKTLWATIRTNDKLNPHVALEACFW